MRVLSIAIAHPLRLVNGATNAARGLSRAVSEFVNIDFAVMWDGNEIVQNGPLREEHFDCTNILDFAGKLAPRSVKVPLYDSRISERISPERYDLVHIHNLIPSFAAERVARRCRKVGVPYVITTHGFNELKEFAAINGFGPLKSLIVHWIITRPFHRIVNGASGIFALSYCEFGMLNELGVPDERIFVVTNGVDEKYLASPTDEEYRNVTEKFALGSLPKLLFMGSLHAYKGVDVFLRSLKNVKHPFQAIVAGQLRSDQQKRDVLNRSGLRRDLAQKVTFTGRVTDAELRALYNVADIFVYPTNGDTLPLVVLEAMACKLPVVSTPVGGIPFAVQPDTGILVPQNEPDSVAEAVNILIADPKQAKRMGERGRQRVESVFSWAKAAKSAAVAYEAVLADRSSSGGAIEPEPRELETGG